MIDTPDNATRHPFLQGLSKHRGAPPTVLIIFGASGDLTARKLVPALYNLGLDDLLPTDFFLIGFGRTPISNEAFQDLILQHIKKFSRRSLNEEVWQKIRLNASYHAGEYEDLKAFQSLHQQVQALEQSLGRELQTLAYISTPPSVFKPILQNLGASGLATRHQETRLCSKVVLEKPFGKDLNTAQELNATITREFKEKQVFRIDHYLGKETVQDLLVLRFANIIFEPLWNHHYVDNVQITVAEDLGVGTRGGYYDQSGALRDMIQNHTMQLLSLVAMEAPVSNNPEDIRSEKVKLLKAIQPLNLQGEFTDVVRGRYTEGLIDGLKVPGYLQEKDILPTSTTETYAALKLSINNWRWNGVPFYIRSGKRMARRVSEIAIKFKPVCGNLFSNTGLFNLATNTLVIQIQPDEGATLSLNSKTPGLETRIQPVKMHFRYATTFGSNTPEAYERLILDAIIGDSTLFIRGDEAEASWKIYTPILNYWETCGSTGLETYSAGSWGPLVGDHLLWRQGHQWRRIGP
jgi:glucose-6-phosphate 1-dehydrogenase